jgi:hydroxymethylpyrimidine kinase/phosphomethylpyrimidine kinase
VARQLRSVLEDFGADAAKCGMLSTAPIIGRSRPTEHRIGLVVDRSWSPSRATSSTSTRPRLSPIASSRSPCSSPQLPEAEVLAGMRVAEPEDMEEAARRIRLMGPRYVLVKGGHLKGDATDLLWNGRDFTRFSTPRVDSQNTHGTGCTFSAAIAAGLARGQALGDAIRSAKAYVTRAIREGFQAGRGVGQLRHFIPDW